MQFLKKLILISKNDRKILIGADKKFSCLDPNLFI